MSSSVNYQNDKSLENYCPDPQLVIEAALLEMGQIVKKEICDVAKSGKTYTDEEARKLQQQIDALTGSNDNSQAIQALVDLVNTLDLDQNGSVLNDLLAIKDVADAAKSDAEKALGDSAATKSAFESFRDSANAAISALQASVQALSARADGHGNSISALQSDMSELRALVEGLPTTSGLTVSEVASMINDSICDFSRRLVAGVEKGVEAFKSVLEGPCPVEGEGEAGDGGAVI